jgi:hypothetical protein
VVLVISETDVASLSESVVAASWIPSNVEVLVFEEPKSKDARESVIVSPSIVGGSRNWL